MAGMTNALANTILAEYFQNSAHWLGLHNTDPTSAGLTGGEITGNSYERLQVNWTAPSNRTVANSNSLTYDNLPAATVNFFALWTAQTGGVIYYVLPVPQMIFNTGGTLIVPVNDITITLQ